MTDYDGGLYDLAAAIDYVLGGGHDSGTGVCYFNDVFAMHGFWNHAEDACSVECEEQQDIGNYEHLPNCPVEMALFHHFETGFKYIWYKRIGRSSEVIEGDLKTLPFYRMIVDCLESVRDDKNPEWRCSVKETRSE